MDTRTLRKLQLFQLDIALEIKRICDKNNIDFFLIGGTLLGAVRHNGIIPWDDDIDIGFTRQNYKRFIKACDKDLNAAFFLQTVQTDPHYGYLFGKIQIRGTQMIEQYAENTRHTKGIFVDIFPFDNMPDHLLKKQYHYLCTALFRKLLAFRSGYHFIHYKKQSHKLRDKFLSLISFFFSRESLILILDKLCQCFNATDTSCIVNLGGNYKYKEYISTQALYPLTKKCFEGYEFPVPANYDELLKHMYGDYMKLPPEEKRRNIHSVVHIDFGSYIPKNYRYASFKCMAQDSE